MTHVIVWRSTGTMLLLWICGIALSCGRSIPAEVLTVSLSNTDAFEYPVVAGDEDGVRVTTQPQHAQVSEIRRDAETNWVATYVYQPVTGYIGSDLVELEILTYSGGMSPLDVRHLTIQFSVHEQVGPGAGRQWTRLLNEDDR